jgi:hypothetical protein
VSGNRASAAIAAALLALALLAGPAKAELDEIWNAPIANWRIAAYRDRDSGRFNNCAVAVRFNSGIALSFRVDALQRLDLGLVNDAWNWSPGEVPAVRYWVDANPPVDGTATIAGAKEIVVELPPLASFMAQLRRGQTLTVSLKDSPMRFNLAGAARMLGEAQQCAKRYAVAAKGAAEAGKSRAAASEATRRQAQKWVESVLAAGAMPDARALTQAEIADWGQGHAADDVAAMWSSPTALGRLSVSALAKGASLDDLAGELVEADQRACSGRFSASKSPDETAFRRLDTVCEGEQGSLVANYILFADADGNAYNVTHLALAGGAKDSYARDAGQAFRTNAFKPGTGGAPKLRSASP